MLKRPLFQKQPTPTNRQPKKRDLHPFQVRTPYQQTYIQSLQIFCVAPHAQGLVKCILELGTQKWACFSLSLSIPVVHD
jgi:hypothetical protein